MKRITLTYLVLILSATVALNQNVPNSGFESWNTTSINTITQWVTSGNVSETTDSYEGKHAIRLENRLQGNIRSFLSSGDFRNKRVQGFPYDEQPLSIRFRAKFDLAPGDRSQVFATFSIGGNYVGIASITIEGNSADTFSYFSVPISWQVSTLPDSAAVLISSNELDSNRVNGDGYIIIDDVHFATISTRNRIIPNGDFETWDETIFEEPTGWNVIDSYLKGVTGQYPIVPLVSKSADSYSGNSGLALESRKVGNDVVSGIATTVFDFKKIERPSFGIDRKWKYLEGFYQYQPVGNDSFNIVAYLFKSGVPIATAQARWNTTQTNYTYFAIPIQYAVNLVPDSATVVIMNSNPDKPGGAGTKLLIDDLQFTDQNLGVFSLDNNKLKIYPNPVIDFLTIDGIKRVEDATFSVVDQTGRILQSGEVTQNLRIDLSDLKSGLYVIHIDGRFVKTEKIIIKQ